MGLGPDCMRQHPEAAGICKLQLDSQYALLRAAVLSMLYLNTQQLLSVHGCLLLAAGGCVYSTCRPSKGYQHPSRVSRRLIDCYTAAAAAAAGVA